MRLSELCYMLKAISKDKEHWMMSYRDPELFCPYCGSKLYYKIEE